MTPKSSDFEEDLEPSTRGTSAATATGLVLAAAAAGLAVGLLMAPDSGEQTRERLRQRMRLGLDDLSEGLGRRVRTLREEGTGTIRRLEKRLNKLEDRFDSARDAAIDAVEEPLERLRSEPRSSGAAPLLGLAAGAALAWFLSSERTADARAQVRDAAEKARRRALDEWDRFQERGGFSRRRDVAPNGGTASENAKSEI
jgi:gas vesicle protein